MNGRFHVRFRAVLGILFIWACSPAFSADTGPLVESEVQSIDAAVIHLGQSDWAVARPSIVEVDPAAFAKNIRNVKKMIGTKLCAVMKSNAYGHGLDNLIPAAIAAEADSIALVDNNEIAVAVKHLRASGKAIPIVRIAPATLAEAVEAVVNRWNVEELVGSLEQGQLLSAVAARLGELTGKPVVIPIHINIDTGMGRMGVHQADDVRAIVALPGLKLKGIMTHFSHSDDVTELGERRTREQVERFQEVVRLSGIGPEVIRHVANSAATARFPWTRLDMVRVGSLLYGDVTKETDPEGIFQPVFRSYKSTVTLIMHDVPPLTTVGYSSEYTTPADRRSTLAAVKVGYNNGYPRFAHRGGTEVLIGGRRYPIVGKVSMNMLVVDVTGQDAGRPIRIGDEVVLVGRQGTEMITLGELASRNQTSTYELALRLGNTNRTAPVGKPTFFGATIP